MTFVAVSGAFAAGSSNPTASDRSPIVAKTIEYVKPVVDAYKNATTYNSKVSGPITVSPSIDPKNNVYGVTLSTSAPDEWKFGKKGK